MNSNIMYHHGILGMKWGKRNGPPYPISASGHSASEKKAGWRKSLDSDSKEKSLKKKKSKLTLTPGQKKALITAGKLAVSAIIAYGSYKADLINPQTVSAGRQFVKANKAEVKQSLARDISKASQKARMLTGNGPFSKKKKPVIDPGEYW